MGQFINPWAGNGRSGSNWAQDGTLTTYLTPSDYSNIIVPDIIRLGANSGTEYGTLEWQDGGGVGGGLIYTSGDSGNSGYHQFFQQSNRCAQFGFASSAGRMAVNSNAFDGGAVGGYNAIAHLRARDAATEAGLLVTLPTTPSNTIHVLRVADASNLFHYMDNTGRAYGPNGTAALPTWSFLNDTDTGMYRSAANVITFAANGARVADINATQVVIPVSRELVFYGTADETTNYERVRVSHSSQMASFVSEASGTGVARSFSFDVLNGTIANFYRGISTNTAGCSVNFQLNDSSSSRTTYSAIFATIDTNTAGAHYGFLSFVTRQNGSFTTANQTAYMCSGYARGSSGIGAAHTFNANINQSGSAAWRGIQFNATIAAEVGTDNRLVDLQLGGTTKAYVGRNGEVVGRRLVSPKTANFNVDADVDNRKVFTNEGSSGTITGTLPSAVAGLDYTFYVQAANAFQITAATGDTIQWAGSVTATGGTISNSTVGGAIRLTAINATEWVATSIVGTWT